MKKRILAVLVVFALALVSVNTIKAIGFEKEYSDNIERYVYKAGTTDNFLTQYNMVKPNSKINLDYYIGSKNTKAQFYSSNKKVATINVNSGVVSFKKAGKVIITIKGSDNRTYKAKFEIESTYVIISIKNQNAKLYVNGKLKKKAPVVTGRAGVTPTPTGTFKIAYKQRDTYLDGATVGYDYYLKVKYWMPLAGTGGVGLHDAPWRAYDQYGGSYYLWDGSHGCINMRTADAGYFFKYIKAGTTVKVY